MRRLTAAEVLAVWEVGQGQHPLDRALTMLAAALPDQSREQLAALPIAERDRLLGRLHELQFGPDLDCYTECPACGKRLEFTAAVPKPSQVQSPKSGPVEPRFRVPDTNDMIAAARQPDVILARAELARRCIVPARGSVAELPDSAVDALVAEMAELMPDAETLVGLSCPACGHEWQEVLEVAEFVWVRIMQQARQLLWEVHMLASAYGWSEQAILGLSPARRRLYLEMLG